MAILYLGTVYGSTHGEYLGSVTAFDIDNFNAIFISDYETKYYCKCYKAKVNFEDMNKEEVYKLLSSYNIIPLESTLDNFKEVLDNIYKEHPELTRFKEDDFEIISKDKYIKDLKENRNKSHFSFASVEIGKKY